MKGSVEGQRINPINHALLQPYRYSDDDVCELFHLQTHYDAVIKQS